jgi:hypothetical protein
VADIPDPVGKARAALSAVDLIQGGLLPDLVSIRRAAIRQARQRMPAQELADRLGISRSPVYAVLAVRMNPRRPEAADRITAFGSTPNRRATSAGVSTGVPVVVRIGPAPGTVETERGHDSAVRVFVSHRRLTPRNVAGRRQPV